MSDYDKPDTETTKEVDPVRAKQNANLKSFKSGDEWTGNRKGRPKGSRNRSSIVKDILESAALDNIRDKHREALGDGVASSAETIADQIVAAQVIKALDGDARALQELLDSAYGKNTDKVESKVSFNRMGSVKVVKKNTSIDGQVTEKALIFDIGDDPDDASQEEVEEEEL